MLSLPSAGARALAADRIALGFVQTRATVPAVGAPFVLRTSYCASCSAVAGLTFALIGSYAGSVKALLSANGHAAAVIGRSGKTLTAVLHDAGLLDRLGFKGDFIVNGVAGTPRWESQTCCERAHFVRLQVRYLHRDEILLLARADVRSR